VRITPTFVSLCLELRNGVYNGGCADRHQRSGEWIIKRPKCFGMPFRPEHQMEFSLEEGKKKNPRN
jgi:hypothetical protein